ncbi:NUDIX domain-containing protein [Clostridium hydrogeniformans]|uniref:NUDIX domain-containing protein n=1 Tax=Clostridium hydrogeniformans TaxID=349933 RepID=UPI00068E2AC4|nr:NUDIX domain-containing protein [Clostridium hydrogeniformans]
MVKLKCGIIYKNQESWYLPGRGVKKGETFEEAVRREFKEELDGELEELKLFGVYNNFYENKNDSIVVFICNDFTFTGKIDSEIEKYDYFKVEDLPEGISPGSRKRINEYLINSYPNVGRW